MPPSRQLSLQPTFNVPSVLWKLLDQFAIQSSTQKRRVACDSENNGGKRTHLPMASVRLFSGFLIIVGLVKGSLDTGLLSPTVWP